MSAGTIVSAEGVVEKSLNDIHEPIDERLSFSPRPSNDQLDQSLGRQLSNLVHPQEKEDDQEKSTLDSNATIYIEFEDGDQRNPINFSLRKKWTITIMACICTLFSSSAASAYNMGFPTMTRDLNCTKFEATIGLSVYALGFGIEFGRQPLYLGSSFGFLLMYMMVALSKNIQTVIIARFFQGATMVGGTIADIWSSADRGLPMSMFAVAALGGTGLGPVLAGWINENPRLEWRWIQWIQMILCGAYFVLLPVLMTETRTAILLTRIAKKIHLMFTEPIVLSFSLWIGFAWGVTYCLIESISGVFRNLHGFNVGEIGTVFITMTIGSLIGFAFNMYQEVLYRKSVAKRGPEARLHMACFAAVLLPIGMFIYAWASFSHVHWIAQAIGITVYIWATFTIYLAVFSYLADCYGPFASSALAGQSLARNLMATAFPLFTDQMFENLGYNWANSLFGFIAVIMIPIPFALFFYGPTIRRHSKFSRMVLEAAQAQK
ncbi:MFS polyamine transporter [Lyophyllum atratum]|nr:MFS polyamine transporter [Lyophyllum atratum]